MVGERETNDRENHSHSFWLLTTDLSGVKGRRLVLIRVLYTILRVPASAVLATATPIHPHVMSCVLHSRALDRPRTKASKSASRSYILTLGDISSSPANGDERRERAGASPMHDHDECI